MQRAFKTAALALLLAFGTAEVALAETAYADGRVRVREEPRRSADTLGWLRDGQRVNVVSCGEIYCRISLRGPDGYVREDDLDWDDDDYRPEPNVRFCIGGGGPAGPGFGFGQLCVEN